ncbi:LysR family transcriptional regulator [Deinococcus pimensis]|uniref:LysR family transcriptional regulator n=1 Tax=Deinococcus pimensis TaxID=309888 RepID=UPI000483AAAA|nr:LysR family transcriptional regulator [Deinococcus pimensis]
MDVDQLRAFVQITRDGSFSRAAETLLIAQPTISNRIHALEKQIGAPLFVRGGRRLQLTPRGERFLTYAQRALELLDEGVDAARTEPRHGGRVSVASTPTLTASLVAPALADLLRLFPHAGVFADTVACEQVMHLLDDGIVRLAVVPSPYAYPPGIEWQELARLHEPLLPVVAPTHPLANREALTWADVREVEWLHVPWTTTHLHDLRRVLPTRDVTLDVPPAVARSLVRTSRWAAFFPPSAVQRDLDRGELRVLPVVDLPDFHRDALLIRHPRGGQLRGAQAALASLLAERMRGAPRPHEAQP